MNTIYEQVPSNEQAVCSCLQWLHVLRYIYPLLAGTDRRICHNVQLDISSAESLMGLRPGGFTHSSSTSILDNETS